MVESGRLGRQEAHEEVRQIAQEAFAKKRHMKELVVERKLLSKKEADELFDYTTYTGQAKKIVEDAVRD